MDCGNSKWVHQLCKQWVDCEQSVKWLGMDRFDWANYWEVFGCSNNDMGNIWKGGGGREKGIERETVN